MQVKKSRGQVFGANLTKDEQKALKMEVRRHLIEENEKNKEEIVAMVLWRLHEQFGFGPERLRRFFLEFDMGIDDLAERYMLEETDDVWLCTQKLRDYGIDISEWRKEFANHG